MSFSIIRIFSYMLGIVGAALLLPFAVGCLNGEERAAMAFGVPMAASLLTALAFWYRQKGGVKTISVEGAFMVVGGIWIVIGLFGALPYYLSGATTTFTDAVFESVSGFTTTGATIMVNVEVLPKSVNLWRCETHWLGGMGVIALAVALIPLLGVGGFRMIKAETTGPEKSKLTSRIATTAKTLWGVYFVFTLTQTLLLRYFGLSWFDALCHAFSTMGTGGFSTYNDSVAHFNSTAVDWTCTAFMLIASVNFTLYFNLLTFKMREVFLDTELRGFLLIVVVAIGAVTLIELQEYGDAAKSLRYSAFQVASIISTTGFVTADYARWLPGAQMVLLVLFLIGGCSGSTAGGVKVVRWAILWKQLKNEFRRLLHPHEIVSLRLNAMSGREEFVPLVASFLFVYMLLVAVTSLVGALSGLGIVESVTGALSMIGNVGPAFGALGPSATFAPLHWAVKWWYSFVMIAGRLEIYTVLILIGQALRRV
ncbi:MAG: TrkH family potassium uptake protein [Kiritimatiellae bacterium]|nr:TrkH family potassium uptake protein [Kiritimatiellia bacterium]